MDEAAGWEQEASLLKIVKFETHLKESTKQLKFQPHFFEIRISKIFCWDENIMTLQLCLLEFLYKTEKSIICEESE